MRQTFDSSMPVAEQLVRSNAMRKVGRKHRHTLGPGSHKRQMSAQELKIQTGKARSFKDKVAAYWRGEIETYPVR